MKNTPKESTTEAWVREIDYSFRFIIDKAATKRLGIKNGTLIYWNGINEAKKIYTPNGYTSLCAVIPKEIAISERIKDGSRISVNIRFIDNYKIKIKNLNWFEEVQKELNKEEEGKNERI